MSLERDLSRRLAGPQHERELSDARTMRALAHPVRIALLEALLLDSPLTATEAGRLIGETPTTCSFHLRQLAKYGLVSEQGRGPGRERRWQLSQTGLRFSDSHDDEDLRLAARALDRVLRERYFARLERWLATADEYPPEWRRASGPLQRVVWVTADEAEAIGEALLEVFEPFSDRLIDADRRPPEATPVELIAFMHPLRKPESSC